MVKKGKTTVSQRKKTRFERWLQKNGACRQGREYVASCDGHFEVFFDRCQREDYFDWLVYKLRSVVMIEYPPSDRRSIAGWKKAQRHGIVVALAQQGGL